ncbi:Inner membrane protein YebZ [Arthrobacter sp. SO5]|uniref:cytochrome c oxidase assembly protein n=1 Tax=Arthrobacter sp. SO5 TaxID=1897055 RepID=UPI0035AC1DCC|nr:Inner membrane protein YebZ [Arthrobacter sp. SO5]
MPSAASSSTTSTPPPPAAGVRRPAGATGISRGWQLAGVVALFVGLAAALLFSGAAAARQVSDPGALVRWGLPVSKAVHNVSLATVIGGLLFAVGILPRSHASSRSKDKDAPEHPAFSRALAVAAAAGATWTLSAIAVLVLSYSDIAGQGISGDPEFTRSLVFFMTDIETGRAWLSVVIIAAVVTTALFGVRSRGALAAVLVLSLIGLVPAALIGHSSSSDDHEGAINSLGLHLVGVSAWVGGIIVLALLSNVLAGARTAADRRSDITEPTLRRFSALAGFAFVLVFASGVVNASIRVTSWGDLFGSSYGQLILAKAAATLVLGGIGLMHRQWVIPQLGSPGSGLSARRVLWQLVAAELLIMGATSGIAVALGRSAPPQPATFAPDASPAFILSGYDLPPELTPERWLTEWRLDWLWVAVAGFGLVSYFLGIRKVLQRGDKWSWFRAVNWVIGLAVLTYVTSGPPSVYGRVMFSAHMVDHMALTMVAPIFLVLGAPVTLALRALTPRRDSSRGPREWLLIFVHSKFSQLVTHPLFAAANFAGSIVLFYYSEAFGYAMRDHVGHELMNLHFALTGYIFVLTMIGTDPLPRRAPYPMRLLLLLATMGFHAFFGVAIMGGTGLLAADYFGNLGRTWGAPALLDQQMGGAVAWGIGEVPTLLVAIGVAVMWSRSDARESKRTDRAADRNNDADLTAYNDMFAKLAERDARLAERNSKLEGRS